MLFVFLMGQVMLPLAGDWLDMHFSQSTKGADTTGVQRSKVPANDKGAVKLALYLERGHEGEAGPGGPDDSGSVLFVPGACLRDY